MLVSRADSVQNPQHIPQSWYKCMLLMPWVSFLYFCAVEHRYPNTPSMEIVILSFCRRKRRLLIKKEPRNQSLLESYGYKSGTQILCCYLRYWGPSQRTHHFICICSLISQALLSWKILHVQLWHMENPLSLTPKFLPELYTKLQPDSSAGNMSLLKRNP